MQQVVWHGLNLIDGTYDEITSIGKKANRGYIIKPRTGPQDDNLYIPSYLPVQGHYWVDSFNAWFGGVTFDGTARIMSRAQYEKAQEDYNAWITGEDTVYSKTETAVGYAGGFLGGAGAAGGMAWALSKGGVKWKLLSTRTVVISAIAAGVFVISRGIIQAIQAPWDGAGSKIGRASCRERVSSPV